MAKSTEIIIICISHRQSQYHEHYENKFKYRFSYTLTILCLAFQSLLVCKIEQFYSSNFMFYSTINISPKYDGKRATTFRSIYFPFNF